MGGIKFVVFCSMAVPLLSMKVQFCMRYIAFACTVGLKVLKLVVLVVQYENSNSSILVAEDGNNRVSIFNKDGKSIHCFGSRGSDDGIFNHPCGIAISPNGNIYVSDDNSKGVQIFSTY